MPDIYNILSTRYKVIRIFLSISIYRGYKGENSSYAYIRPEFQFVPWWLLPPYKTTSTELSKCRW